VEYGTVKHNSVGWFDRVQGMAGSWIAFTLGGPIVAPGTSGHMAVCGIARQGRHV